jgi:hypothetical protein
MMAVGYDRPGHGWFRRGQPARQRATCRRTAGVRQMLATPDLTSGPMFYRFRDRKRWPQRSNYGGVADFDDQLR